MNKIVFYLFWGSILIASSYYLLLHIKKGNKDNYNKKVWVIFIVMIVMILLGILGPIDIWLLSKMFYTIVNMF